MARIRKRVCLQDGPFLNIHWLLRNNVIDRAGHTADRPINWSSTNSGVVASGFVTANLGDNSTGWLKIYIAGSSQTIALAGQPRNFGGRQWYFICPVTGRHVSVLWKPPGALQFASRHAWPSQVAYLTQFGNWIDRAHLGKARMKVRLRSEDGPDKSELPARPRGMHIRTYSELARRFELYQGKLDDGLAAFVSRYYPPQ